MTEEYPCTAWGLLIRINICGVFRQMADVRTYAASSFFWQLCWFLPVACRESEKPSRTLSAFLQDVRHVQHEAVRDGVAENRLWGCRYRLPRSLPADQVFTNACLHRGCTRTGSLAPRQTCMSTSKPMLGRSSRFWRPLTSATGLRRARLRLRSG